MKTFAQALAAFIAVAVIAGLALFGISTKTTWLDKPSAVQVITALDNKAPKIDLGKPVGGLDTKALFVDLGTSDSPRDLRDLPVVGVCPNLTPAGEVVLGVARDGEEHLKLSCINAAVSEPVAPAPPIEIPPAPPAEEAPAPEEAPEQEAPAPAPEEAPVEAPAPEEAPVEAPAP